MNAESSQTERKDYEIPCRLLPGTELNFSEGIAADKTADVPIGGLVRDELLHEAIELDFLQPGQANGQPPQSTDSPMVYVRARKGSTAISPTGWDGWPSTYHCDRECTYLNQAEAQSSSDDKLETKPLDLAIAKANGWNPCHRCAK